MFFYTLSSMFPKKQYPGFTGLSYACTVFLPFITAGFSNKFIAVFTPRIINAVVICGFLYLLVLLFSRKKLYALVVTIIWTAYLIISLLELGSFSL